MKNIVLTIIVVVLTILNMFLLKDYYNKKENNTHKTIAQLISLI